MKTDFFNKLASVNSAFYTSLYFCTPQHREPVAALISLYTQLTTLPLRITEPLAIQMRLTWWREAFEKPLVPNLPPEIEILKPYDLPRLIETIEHEYVHQTPEYQHQSSADLFELIAEITDFKDYQENAAEYGIHYSQLIKQDTNPKLPKVKLPLGLRFLRVPIILTQSQNRWQRGLKLIGNFII